MGSFFAFFNKTKPLMTLAALLGGVYFVLLLTVPAVRLNPYLAPAMFAFGIGLLISRPKDAGVVTVSYLAGCLIGFLGTFAIKFFIATSANQGAVSQLGFVSSASKIGSLVLTVGLLPWVVGLPIGVLIRTKFVKS